MFKIKNIFSPKLRLVRGTRLISALFIGTSIALAAGILWAANMYYNIDTGEVVVEQIQRVGQLLRATAGLVIGGADDYSLPAGIKFEVKTGNIRFSTTGTIEQTGTGQVTFAGNVDATGGLDVTNAALTVGGTNFQVATTGVLTWGGDTNLYRDAANVLKTDDDFIMGANATTTANLSVGGDVTVDGDLHFLGNQNITGTGTLTINPTGNLYFQSTSNYLDENGNLILAGRIDSSKLQYSGNITIAANSATTTTVTITNDDGTHIADLSVEGDINVQGGKITLATGETIDAETADQVTINSNGITVIKSGGTEIFRVDSNGVVITGVATTTDTLYVTSGGAQITGSVQISSGDLTVGGNVLPSADATYNLGSATARWANLYAATTTIGTASTYLTLGQNTITATHALTIQFDDSSGFILQNDASPAVKFIEIEGTSGKLTLRSASGQEIVLDPAGAEYGIVRVAAGDTLYVDNIAISGEGRITGIVPIFGFDLPAQTASTSYVKVSRDLENYPFSATTTGTTRVHKLIFRYSASTTAELVWRVSTSTNQTYSSSTLPVPDSNDLNKGNAYIATTTIPTDGTDWWLEIKTPTDPDVVRIFQIFLAAFDVKQ